MKRGDKVYPVMDTIFGKVSGKQTTCHVNDTIKFRITIKKSIMNEPSIYRYHQSSLPSRILRATSSSSGTYWSITASWAQPINGPSEPVTWSSMGTSLPEVFMSPNVYGWATLLNQKPSRKTDTSTSLSAITRLWIWTATCGMWALILFLMVNNQIVKYLCTH